MKIEWLLVWAEYWTADSEPQSAAKAEAEVERQIKEQSKDLTAMEDALKATIDSIDDHIRKMRESESITMSEMVTALKVISDGLAKGESDE